MKKRIWEQKHYQCSIIGTCLNIRELHKIARQANLVLPATISEFELHGAIVSGASNKSIVGKITEKMLNKKYAAYLHKISKLQSENELIEAWQEALASGDIPGPYWAILSHPQATEKLRNRAFGEVHMLSHLVGAANRADIKTLAMLEKNLQAENERTTRFKRLYRMRFKELGKVNAEKKKMLKAAELELNRLQQLDTPSSISLSEKNLLLHKQLQTQSTLRTKYENENKKLQDILLKQQNEMNLLKEELQTKQQELLLLEKELQNITHTCPDDCEMAGTNKCPGQLLCGKKILYVGGRTNLVHHYRSLVERHGASFIYHDGGIEDTNNSLPKLLGTVDSVICPIDCVSHNACLLVKNVCKQRVKPLKFIRSSSLSSLKRSLIELEKNEEFQRV